METTVKDLFRSLDENFRIMKIYKEAIRAVAYKCDIPYVRLKDGGWRTVCDDNPALINLYSNFLQVEAKWKSDYKKKNQILSKALDEVLLLPSYEDEDSVNFIDLDQLLEQVEETKRAKIEDFRGIPGVYTCPREGK
ncbi:MAG: hypothetical protein WC942_07650 [Clostridia bacterium]